MDNSQLKHRELTDKIIGTFYEVTMNSDTGSSSQFMKTRKRCVCRNNLAADLRG